MKSPIPLASYGWLICLLMWSGGCADEGIDQEDELTTGEDGRYELVLLDKEHRVAQDSTLIEHPADMSGEPANAAVFFDPEGQFTVQVGVYRNEAHATTMIRELKREGYPAYGSKSSEGMRVRIGYFSQLKDAERFGKIFAADRGVEYWIDKRADE